MNLPSMNLHGPQRMPRRIQTPGPAQHNMRLGSDRRKLLGGGGMAVGPLRHPRGHPLHPKAARVALLGAMQGED